MGHWTRRGLVSAPTPPGILRVGALVLIPRVVLFVTGLIAAAGSAGGDWGAGLARMWSHWDPGHYLRIADVGYRSTGEDALFIVFFPLFPLLVAVVGFVVRNLVVAALLVTTASSIAAGWLLYRLTRLDDHDPVARGAVVLLFAFPTAYALFAPFSEAVFLACVLGSVYMARTGRWWWAGTFGLAAAATRMVGLALVPALLVEAVVVQRASGGAARKLAAVCLVPLGFLAYLGVNTAVHGHPMHFLEVQDEHWFQHAVPPWVPVTDSIEAVRDTEMTVENLLVHPSRLAGIAFALVVLAYGWRRLGWTDRTFATATMLMVLSASWLISMPRYLLSIYPVFTILGGAGRHRWLLWPAAAVGFALQLWLFARFARGMWAF